MKRIPLLLAFALFAGNLSAQYAGYPIIYTWVRNLTNAVGYDNIPSNVLSVKYDTSNVYIAADCIPGYDIGPWTSNPNTPSNQNFVYKITRNPVRNTGTLTTIGLGHTGVWSNGVSVYNVSDAMSYNNAGVWYRNAYYFEGISFDSCLGHPAPNGEYHNHVNPICLYDETDSTRHSPIIGYAFDGYPIYGTFGYANADGTGGIKRITSSYVVSTATTRANGPAVSTSYPAGCFLEDWIYTPGAGDLDSLNGRFCVTPEYPNGTYCYYATLGPGEKPTFPYTMYKNYYGIVQSGNVNNGGHNTAPTGDSTYTTLYVPTITITGSADTICAGTAVTFIAHITTGGPGPLYAWYVNGVMVGTDSTYSSSSLVNNDTVKCILTSNAYYVTSNTVTSNKIVVTVKPVVTPAVSVGASQTTICQGTNVVFTATPVNGGNATYQWVKNGTDVGSNSDSYSNGSLNNNDSVWVIMTSSASCANPTTATSSVVVISVATHLTPAINISSSAGDTVCSSTPVTFSSTISNGGTSPVYQWLLNNVVAGNSATYNPAMLNNGDVVQCILHSNATCATTPTDTSNAILMHVVATPGTPAISVNTPVCTNGNLQLNTDSISSATYQWTGPNGFTSSIQNPVINNPSQAYSGNYNLVVSVGSCNSQPGQLTVTVNSSPGIPTITQQGNVLVSSAVSNNQWLLNDNAINGATAQDYTVSSA